MMPALCPCSAWNIRPTGRGWPQRSPRQNGITIKILTADGGTVASFHSPTLGGGAPTWTPDGKAVILLDRTVRRYVRVDIANPAQRSPAAGLTWGALLRSATMALSQPGSKSPGIWQIDKEPRLISSKYPIRFDPPITFRGDDVLVPDFDAPDGPRILAQPAGRRAGPGTRLCARR